MLMYSLGFQSRHEHVTKHGILSAVQFGIDEARMITKLWGDNFFDPATKKWTTYKTDSKTCMRGFVQFCYNPIKQVRRSRADQLSSWAT
jgi:elongation factor 2